mmetsp:Transcript_20113/g.53689  ORF Transcript_20113/g.53689 Transcript_20113/m.53689 type:complete len:233 (+) Transcript_20113:266-964(+)
MPVEGDHRLCREIRLIQHLHGPGHSPFDPLLILDHALLGIGILEHGDGAVATARREDLAILREEVTSPQCGLRDPLRAPSKALGWMIGAEIVDHQAGLQGGHSKLVHPNVLAVELQVAHTILHVRVPTKGHGTKVEEFDVTVVVACSDASLCVVVGVAERHGPAIRRRLAFHRHQRHDRIFLTRIPHLYGAIAAPRHKLGSPVPSAQAADTVYGVDDQIVALHTPDRLLEIF